MTTISTRLTNQITTEFAATVLINLLKNDCVALNMEIEQAFEHWHLVVGALPLPTGEYVFAHNWITSAQKLWREGDVATAIYQLRQVARKLEL